MLFIAALIIVAAIIGCFADKIKKYPYVFYCGAAAVTIMAFAADSMSAQLGMPVFVRQNILGIVTKGTLGTAMFAVVMYAGALPSGTKLTKLFMKIRGELSITAAILVLCHNIVYGKTYFRLLFKKSTAISATSRAAAIVSLILILLMLVLTITSFPSVRKRMKAQNWKKLQRSAYIFYALTYVHIMLISVPYARSGLTASKINVVVYSIVFMLYAAMRISKGIYRKTKDELYARRLAGAVRTVCALTGMAVCIAAFTGNTEHQNLTAGKDSRENNTAQKVMNGTAAYTGTAEYTGTAVCDVYGYKVTVVMTMDNGKITSVSASSDADRDNLEYFEMAEAQIPEKIIEKQGTKGVDAVSGATLSSKAIKTAFYNAYKSATR